MSDARSDSYIRFNQRKPFKVVVCAITLVAFFVNTFAYDIAWAGGTPSELTSVGSDRATGPGLSSSANASEDRLRELDPATFKLPDSLGTIKDSWSPRNPNSKTRTIIHIQDAHCNYGAQTKIAEIVEYLNKEYGIDKVNLEGGAREYDLSPFTDIKDKALRLKASDHFVKEGLVNGAEYFAVNNPKKVTLWGIEDPKLYVENLYIYRNSVKNREAIDRYLKSLSHILSNLKAKIYSKELFEFDLKYGQYKADNLEFKDYLSYLIQKSKERSVDIKKLTDIYLLSQALDEESKIDFNRANNERDSLIDLLQKKLSKRMLEELVVKSVEFKSDKISQKDYYSYLAAKALVVKVDLKGFPELQKYIVYIAMYDAINKANVMEELGLLEDAIKASLYRTDEERRLSELSKNLALLKNIFGISITRQDYEYYKKNEDLFSMRKYVSFITDKAPPYGITATLDDDISNLDKYREDMIGFYEYSLKRDKAFLKNLRLDKTAIIITGGFHTENLTELFKKNNIAYVSIMPNFRNENGYTCYYYKLLSGEKSLNLKAQLPSVLNAALAIPDPMTQDPLIRQAADGKPAITPGPAVSAPAPVTASDKVKAAGWSPVDGEFPVIHTEYPCGESRNKVILDKDLKPGDILVWKVAMARTYYYYVRYEGNGIITAWCEGPAYSTGQYGLTGRISNIQNVIQINEPVTMPYFDTSFKGVNPNTPYMELPALEMRLIRSEEVSRIDEIMEQHQEKKKHVYEAYVKPVEQSLRKIGMEGAIETLYALKKEAGNDLYANETIAEMESELILLKDIWNASGITYESIIALKEYAGRLYTERSRLSNVLKVAHISQGLKKYKSWPNILMVYYEDMFYEAMRELGEGVGDKDTLAAMIEYISKAAPGTEFTAEDIVKDLEWLNLSVEQVRKIIAGLKIAHFVIEDSKTPGMYRIPTLEEHPPEPILIGFGKTFAAPAALQEPTPGAGSWSDSPEWMRSAWFTETGISLGIGSIAAVILALIGLNDQIPVIAGAISSGGFFWFMHVFRNKKALKSAPIIALGAGTIAASLALGFLSLPIGIGAVSGLMAWHYLNNKYFTKAAINNDLVERLLRDMSRENIPSRNEFLKIVLSGSPVLALSNEIGVPIERFVQIIELSEKVQKKVVLFTQHELLSIKPITASEPRNMIAARRSVVEADLVIANGRAEPLITGMPLIGDMLKAKQITIEQLEEVIKLCGGDIKNACETLSKLSDVIKRHGINSVIELAQLKRKEREKYYIISSAIAVNYFDWLLDYKDLLSEIGPQAVITLTKALETKSSYDLVSDKVVEEALDFISKFRGLIGKCGIEIVLGAIKSVSSQPASTILETFIQYNLTRKDISNRASESLRIFEAIMPPSELNGKMETIGTVEEKIDVYKGLFSYIVGNVEIRSADDYFAMLLVTLRGLDILADPDSFVAKLKNECLRNVNKPFNYNDLRECYASFIGAVFSGISYVSWHDYIERINDLKKFDTAHPGYFRGLFDKGSGLKTIQVSEKNGRQLDISAVDESVLTANRDELLSIRKRINNLDWIAEDFPNNKVFNLRNLYFQLKKQLAQESGSLKPDERFNLPDLQKISEKIMHNEILGNSKLFYKMVFKLAMSQRANRQIADKCLKLMRDLIVCDILTDEALLMEMQSSDFEMRQAAFKQIYEDRKNHLPNALGLRLDNIKGLPEAFGELSKNVYEELAKARVVQLKGLQEYTLVPQGFLSVFRGRAGMVDCSFDRDDEKGHPYTRAMHEDTMYYFVYKGKELKGYIGLMVGETGEGHKVLTIDTVNSPSLDGKDLLTNLFTAFAGLAQELGCDGIALPENMAPSFNFDNEDTIEDMEVYKRGTPIEVKPLHQESWKNITKMFAADKYNSIESGSFILLNIPVPAIAAPAEAGSWFDSPEWMRSAWLTEAGIPYALGGAAYGVLAAIGMQDFVTVISGGMAAGALFALGHFKLFQKNESGKFRLMQFKKHAGEKTVAILTPLTVLGAGLAYTGNLWLSVPCALVLLALHYYMTPRAPPAAVPSPKTVQESPSSFEYQDPSQDFKGIDLEHFVVAQRRLAQRRLPEDKLLEALASGKCGKKEIDEILKYNSQTGESTFEDPRLDVSIFKQSGLARKQSILEAVSNSLDALLSVQIGQFGKGVKQIIAWLEANGKDRIDVWTAEEKGSAYQLTILKDKLGQYYIQVRQVARENFKEMAARYSGRDTDHGTVVKVSVQKKIPQEESRISQDSPESLEAIASDIHKRFPVISGADIYTQIEDEPEKLVNDFDKKVVIVPAGKRVAHESQGRFVFVKLEGDTIAIVDNGSGMGAKAITGMFVPEVETKEPLSVKVEDELSKVMLLQDETLAPRISFSRNGEVIMAVDIPEGIHPDALMPDGGGLMLECGLLFNVLESRGKMVIGPLFEQAVLNVVGQILSDSSRSAEDKVRYISTLVVGLDGLVLANDMNANLISGIKGKILTMLSPHLDELRKADYIILPFQEEFSDLVIPQGKKALFVHDGIFTWGVSTLKAMGGRVIPWMNVGDKERDAVPLVIVPFSDESLAGIHKFSPLWFTWKQRKRVPIIKNSRFVAIPEGFGNRLLELAAKRPAGLSAIEQLEFLFLTQLIKIITAEEVVTSYETSKPKESLKLDDIVFSKSNARIDERAVNDFLTKLPNLAGEAAKEAIVPQDAGQKYVLLANGNVIEAGTKKVIIKEIVKELVPLRHGYYKINLKSGASTIRKLDSLKAGQPIKSDWDIFGKDSNISPILAETKIGLFKFSPDYRFAYVDIDGETGSHMLDMQKGVLIDLFNFKEVTKREFHKPGIKYRDVNFTPDGKHLSYISFENGISGIYMPDLETGEVFPAPAVTGHVVCVLNENAPVLATTRSTNRNKITGLFNLERRQGISLGISTPVEAYHVSAAGRLIFIKHTTGETEIYDLKEGKAYLPQNFGLDNFTGLTTLFVYSDSASKTVPTYLIEAVKSGEAGGFMFSDSPGPMQWLDKAHVDSLCKLVDHVENYSPDPSKGLNLYSKDGIMLGKNLKKHPDLPLFIDESGPENAVILPTSGKRIGYPKDMEILDCDVSGKVYFVGRFGITSEGIGGDTAKDLKPSGTRLIAYDKIPRPNLSIFLRNDNDKYAFKGKSIELDWWEYNVNFDGKYFVFFNPKTGDVHYLDTEHPEDFAYFSGEASIPEKPTDQRPAGLTGLRLPIETRAPTAAGQFEQYVRDDHKKLSILFSSVEVLGNNIYIAKNTKGEIVRIFTWDPVTGLKKFQDFHAMPATITAHNNNIIVLRQTDPVAGERYTLFDIGLMASCTLPPDVKSVEISVSGKYSLVKFNNGNVYVYDNSNFDPFFMSSGASFEGFELSGQADAAICKMNGRYNLYNFDARKFEIGGAEYIRADSSGELAIFKKDGKLRVTLIKGGLLAQELLDTQEKLPPVDEIYINRSGEDAHIILHTQEGEYHHRAINMRYGGFTGELIDNFMSNDFLPYFYEKYDLNSSRNWIFERPTGVNFGDGLIFKDIFVGLSPDGKAALVWELSSRKRTALTFDRKTRASYSELAGGTILFKDDLGLNKAFVVKQSIEITQPNAVNGMGLVGYKVSAGSRKNLVIIDGHGKQTSLPENYALSDVIIGRYLVLYNSITNATEYLDLEGDSKNIPFVQQVEPAAGPGRAEEQQKALELWKKEVLMRRDTWIKEAQAAYQPLLVLIPADFRTQIEERLSGLIRQLYKSQENEIDSRFVKAAAGEGFGAANLPFEVFSKRLAGIKLILGQEVSRLAAQINQTNYGFQGQCFGGLFDTAINLAIQKNIDIQDLDAASWEAVFYGWQINSEEEASFAPKIANLIAGIKEVGGYGAQPKLLYTITRFLSDFARRDSARNIPIIKAQLAKILSAKPNIREGYIKKLIEAFSDVKQEDLSAFLKDNSVTGKLGKARAFAAFLTTDKVDFVETRERFVPDGKELLNPDQRLKISAISKLNDLRLKGKTKEGQIMPVQDLINASQNNLLPEEDPKLEGKLLLKINNQREPGAYAAEIAQNSKDARRPGAAELVISYYLQEAGSEFVEEAIDNGTGALREVALLIDKSTKAAGEQIDATGFFGKGKYTIFEGVDRVEIISNNGSRSLMFTFTIERDAAGNAISVYISSIREITDPKIKQGVTVRRIKKVSNCVPELEQMLAQRSWKTFAALSQGEDKLGSFNIYFSNNKGERRRLEGAIGTGPQDSHILGSVDFKEAPHRPGETPQLRIISSRDMPSQVVDAAGLRICELKSEYLELIPVPLRRHIEEMGIIIQIPLLPTGDRSDFIESGKFLPLIQKYVAIAFYRALAYQSLTQNDPQFVFEGAPNEFETNDDNRYWDELVKDKKITELAEKINRGEFDKINNNELGRLKGLREQADTDSKFVRLVLQLKVAIPNAKPSSMLLRRIAVQKTVNPEGTNAQVDRLKQEGSSIDRSEVPSADEVPYFAQKREQADKVLNAHEQMAYLEDLDLLIPPNTYTREERELVAKATPIAKLFGLEEVRLAKSEVSFAGGFIRSKKIMVLNQSVALQMGLSLNNHFDEATDTIVHELAHYLVGLMRKDAGDVVVNPVTGFTHQPIGLFADAMKYISAVISADKEGKPRPEFAQASAAPAGAGLWSMDLNWVRGAYWKETVLSLGVGAILSLAFHLLGLDGISPYIIPILSGSLAGIFFWRAHAFFDARSREIMNTPTVISLGLGTAVVSALWVSGDPILTGLGVLTAVLLGYAHYGINNRVLTARFAAAPKAAIDLSAPMDRKKELLGKAGETAKISPAGETRKVTTAVMSETDDDIINQQLALKSKVKAVTGNDAWYIEKALEMPGYFNIVFRNDTFIRVHNEVNEGDLEAAIMENARLLDYTEEYVESIRADLVSRLIKEGVDSEFIEGNTPEARRYRQMIVMAVHCIYSAQMLSRRGSGNFILERAEKTLEPIKGANISHIATKDYLRMGEGYWARIYSPLQDNPYVTIIDGVVNVDRRLPEPAESYSARLIAHIFRRAIANIKELDAIQTGIRDSDSYEMAIEKINEALRKMQPADFQKADISIALGYLNNLPYILSRYDLGEVQNIDFAKANRTCVLRTSKGRYVLKEGGNYPLTAQDGIPEDYAVYEFNLIEHLRNNGVFSPALIPARNGGHVVMAGRIGYLVYEYFDGYELTNVADVARPGYLESVGRMIGRVHAATIDYNPGGAGRASLNRGLRYYLNLGNINEARSRLITAHDLWIQRRDDPQYERFFKQDTPITSFLRNYDTIMGLLDIMGHGVTAAGGYASLPNAAIHGDLFIPWNVYFKGSQAIAPFDFEMAKNAKRIDDLGVVLTTTLINDVQDERFQHPEDILQLLLRFYRSYQETLPVGKKLTYGEAMMIKEAYRCFILGRALRRTIITGNRSIDSVMEDWLRWSKICENSFQAAAALDMLDWDKFISELGIKKPFSASPMEFAASPTNILPITKKVAVKLFGEEFIKAHPRLLKLFAAFFELPFTYLGPIFVNQHINLTLQEKRERSWGTLAIHTASLATFGILYSLGFETASYISIPVANILAHAIYNMLPFAPLTIEEKPAVAPTVKVKAPAVYTMPGQEEMLTRGLSELKSIYPELEKGLDALKAGSEILVIGPGYGFEILDIMHDNRYANKQFQFKSIGLPDENFFADANREKLTGLIRARYYSQENESDGIKKANADFDMLKNTFREGNVEIEGAIPDKAYDAVILGNNVMEHIEDRISLIQRIYSAIRPGGVGFIELRLMAITRSSGSIPVDFEVYAAEAGLTKAYFEGLGASRGEIYSVSIKDRMYPSIAVYKTREDGLNIPLTLTPPGSAASRTIAAFFDNSARPIKSPAAAVSASSAAPVPGTGTAMPEVDKIISQLRTVDTAESVASVIREYMGPASEDTILEVADAYLYSRRAAGDEAGALINNAFALGLFIHSGWTRRDATPLPYIAHPAYMVMDILSEPVENKIEMIYAICEAWLHDAVEDANRGIWGRKFLEGNPDTKKLTVVVRDEIAARTNIAILNDIDTLTRLYAGIDTVSNRLEDETEALYYARLRTGSRSAQRVKFADLTDNFLSFRRVNDPADPTFPQRFFNNHITQDVFGFIESAKVDNKIKMRLLGTIRANSALPITVSDAQNRLIMEAAIRELFSSGYSDSSDMYQIALVALGIKPVFSAEPRHLLSQELGGFASATGLKFVPGLPFPLIYNEIAVKSVLAKNPEIAPKDWDGKIESLLKELFSETQGGVFAGLLLGYPINKPDSAVETNLEVTFSYRGPKDEGIEVPYSFAISREDVYNPDRFEKVRDVMVSVLNGLRMIDEMRGVSIDHDVDIEDKDGNKVYRMQLNSKGELTAARAPEPEIPAEVRKVIKAQRKGLTDVFTAKVKEIFANEKLLSKVSETVVTLGGREIRVVNLGHPEVQAFIKGIEVINPDQTIPTRYTTDKLLDQAKEYFGDGDIALGRHMIGVSDDGLIYFGKRTYGETDDAYAGSLFLTDYCRYSNLRVKLSAHPDYSYLISNIEQSSAVRSMKKTQEAYQESGLPAEHFDTDDSNFLIRVTTDSEGYFAGVDIVYADFEIKVPRRAARRAPETPAPEPTPAVPSISYLKTIIESSIKGEIHPFIRTEVGRLINEKPDPALVRNAAEYAPGLFKIRDLKNGDQISFAAFKSFHVNRARKIMALATQKYDSGKLHISATDLKFLTDNIEKAVELLFDSEIVGNITNAQFEELLFMLARMIDANLYEPVKEASNKIGEKGYAESRLKIKELEKADWRAAFRNAVIDAGLGNELEATFHGTETANAKMEDRLINIDEFLNAMYKKMEHNEGKTVVYFLDNAGEVFADLLVIEMLLDRGFNVRIAAKDAAVADDLTAEDVVKLLSELIGRGDDYAWLKRYYDTLNPKAGRLSVWSSGSRTQGLDLNKINSETFSDVVFNIIKGGGNLYGACPASFAIDSFHIFMVKSSPDLSLHLYILGNSGIEAEKVKVGYLAFLHRSENSKPISISTKSRGSTSSKPGAAVPVPSPMPAPAPELTPVTMSAAVQQVVPPAAVSAAVGTTINTVEARSAAVTEAFKEANGRSTDVRVVQGVPLGSMASAQTIANGVSRTLAKNFYGIRDGTKQIYPFEIDPNSADQTEKNMLAAITKAGEGLLADGRLVIFAPQMDNGLNLADKVKQVANVTVLRDAYTDYEYPDMVARMAIARNISFYYESNDAAVLRVISNLLENIAQGKFKLDAIDDLFRLTLRIKPVDYNKDMAFWKNAQLATAVAA